jgi:hypothetical protein
MTCWTIARVKQVCGCCREDIAVGDPLLKMHLAGVRRLRCATCGEPHLAKPAAIEPQDFDGAVPEGISYQPTLGGLS